MGDVDASAARDLFSRFHTVPQTRAHHDVIDQIVFGIRAGLIRTGEQLPTVETMANLTGVSKPVVGEAIRVLREHGVVSTRRGVHGGVTIVTDDIPNALLRVTSGWRRATLTELIEARRPIEAELALLAGIRGTRDDFAAMRETLGLLKLALRDENSGSVLKYDHRLHYQIGLAARSEMLAFHQHRVLSESAPALDEYGFLHEIPELAISTHEAMLDAIESRDPTAIRSAADWHWRISNGVFAETDGLEVPDQPYTAAQPPR